MPCTNSSFKCLVEYLNCIFFKCMATAGRLYVGPLERYEGSWRRMAYSRLLSLRGDRRETANDDSRRSRPAVDRLCRPKGGMNDQLTYMSHFIRHIQQYRGIMSPFVRYMSAPKNHRRGF